MKLRMKSMPFAILQIVASGALSVAMAHPAYAQEAAAVPETQRVVVTGSLISRSDKETASPVQVLTADDIAKSGSTSIAEVLSNLSANGQGALGTGFAGAFANGAAGVSLRGLSVGLTLVLIDGHRMAPYPLSDDAQRQFVDVSAIPFDAVERIEVLKDGASSTYGSDAIAGVINIILKKSFKGTTVKADYGTTQEGGGETSHVAIMHGFGDLNTDGYNAYGSVEFRHENAIKVSDRDDKIWANGNWVSRGGSDLTRGVPTAINSYLTAASTPFFYKPNSVPNPVTGLSGAKDAANFQFLDPNCNFAKYSTGGCAVRDTVSFIQPDTKNVNALVGFTKKLGEDWELSLKASVFQRESTNNRGLGAVFSPTSFLGNTALVPNQNPKIVNIYGSTLFPANYPGNTLGAPVRLYGYIPGLDPANTQDNKATSSRASADLTGSWNGWDVAAAVGYTRVKTEDEYSGYVNRIALYQALNRSTNPFKITGGNTQADMDAISPHFGDDASDTLTYGDAHASHPVIELPGGDMMFAAGVSYTHKNLDAPSPSLLAQGTVGSGSAYVFGKETNTALYAELSAPVIKSLELGVSGRYDHYDTYGHSFTPKADFKYHPIDMLSVRGTYSRGFRAPNAAENGTASSLFNFHAVNDPILCADGNPKTKGNVPAACGFTPAFVQETTKDVSPEKSKSYTFGLIIEPTHAFSSTFDYYHIAVSNQINTAAGLPGFVPTYVRNAPSTVDIADGKGGTTPGVPSVGTVAYATSGYVNSGGTTTSGVELTFLYKQRFGDYGTVKSELSLNHMISYELDSNGVQYELAGTHGPSVISGDTGNPKNRAQYKLGWEKGAVTVTGTVNWVGDYSGLDPSVDVTDCKNITAGVSGRTYFFGTNTPAGYCHIPSFLTLDLNATFQASKNLQLKFSILNAFNKQPPIDVATYGNANSLTSYNASLHQAGAVGRFFSMGANYAF